MSLLSAKYKVDIDQFPDTSNNIYLDIGKILLPEFEDRTN